MQASKIVLRITKILGKALLGVVIILLIGVALIHLPLVQKKVTGVVANYLSSKIESRVDINSVTFSLLGEVTIKEITVWDRSERKIISARKVEVSTSISNLIKGDYIFNVIHLDGVEGELVQREEGLNIQFILDAFQSKKNQPTTTSSNPVTLQFRKVQLENILFKFNSLVSGIAVDVNLGILTLDDAEFSSHPTKIKADQVILQNTVVNTLSTTIPVTTPISIPSKNNPLLLRPDFGSGIVFEIRDLELKEDDFSFHKEQVTTTRKFNPAHLDLKNIQLKLTDILIHPDTLTAEIQALAVQLPGFTLAEMKADLQLNNNQLVLSRLHLASGVSELKANLTAPNDLNALKDANPSPIDLAVQGRVNPHDFTYFLGDSVMNQFNSWGPTEVTLEANYTMGRGNLKTLSLKTGNSQLLAKGQFNDVLDPEKINWQNVVMEALIGADFKRIIVPFVPTLHLPPDITLQAISSGGSKNIEADTKVFTTWGNVKATGFATIRKRNLGIDIKLAGENVDPGQWLNLAWIGPTDLSLTAIGTIGDQQNIDINGLITDITLLNQPMQQITFHSNTREDSAAVAISIADLNYRSEINSEISFAGPLSFANTIWLDHFKLGKLLQMDSSLSISGSTTSNIIIDLPALEGSVEGDSILLQNKTLKYLLDTLYLHTAISPTASKLEYYSENAMANLSSNFDIRDLREVIQHLTGNMLDDSVRSISTTGDRTATVSIDMQNASLFQLLGIDVKEFSSLQVEGELDEQKQTARLQAASGKFKGYGISLDTLQTNLTTFQDSISARMDIRQLLYNTIPLGNLEFDIVSKGDTAISKLSVTNDTITTLGLQVRILPIDSGVLVYPDQLLAFDHDYRIDPQNPVYLGKNNLAFNHFQVSGDDTQINLNGDLNYFDVSVRNINLTRLNFLLSSDTTIINEGNLTAKVSYTRDQQLDLKADIDHLILYNSSPLTISAMAVSDGNHVPFEFLLTNTSNKINLKGDYSSDQKEIDASLLLDINDLELFSFLVSGFIEKMNGSLHGEGSISGPIKTPVVKGNLKFQDVGLTTVNPRLTFNIEEEMITLNNSSIVLDDFTLYDKDHHPLTISGNLTSEDYQSYTYDFLINSDNYALINNPDSTSGKLRGLLVLDSDIKLKGNEKDTNVEAKLTIKGTTDLTLVSSSDDIQLLKAEGIIDFVDPALLLDSTALEPSVNYYDSLVASLPDFNLNSTVTIEDNAVLRLIIDEQSGDYIEASGGANLELGYDRTGNLRLTGNYTIRKGVYRLSFYDLVKKNFSLVQGSSVNWSGSPKNGDLNIKAVHTVESNSIGLIGHEIGENEKSIYKRSLDYQVGININGTIEKPIISFSLDLPKEEKVSYPVLANKLDRLRQPEYESELNKQVFGLLVLGGFLPETSGSDINSSLIATTALSNSVNSLLASQLNRFASQYIKGVNIDVGIQSYSDYSSPGGKTQTAMDFRVSKSILNERLSFEIGGDFDINQDQSGANTGTKNYRGDIAIIYDLTGNGDKQLKLFNNETYDIIYQEIRNTGISLIFIREFENKEKKKGKK